MDGTPVDNNRLVLAPFLNTLTVQASPSLSVSQYAKDRKSSITTEKKRVGLQKMYIKSDLNKKRLGRISWK